MTWVSVSQPQEPWTAGAGRDREVPLDVGLGRSATGESNWTISGMPTPTTEPVLGSTW